MELKAKYIKGRRGHGCNFIKKRTINIYEAKVYYLTQSFLYVLVPFPVVRINLHLWVNFSLNLSCTAKYNEAPAIKNRKRESCYPHVTIINHVALYEKTPWKYWKCCYLGP